MKKNNYKNILCIVQARCGSKRLKNKVVKKVNGKSLLEILINRLSFSEQISKLVIATTKKDEDKKIIKIAKNNKISFFKGSEKNVLKRYFDCASKYEAAQVVRITADCPLSDSKMIDKLIKMHKKNKADYSSNINPRTYPDGLDVEVFSYNLLSKVQRSSTNRLEKEHVTLFIKKLKRIKKINLSNNKDYSKLRWTVDNKKDYMKIKKMFKLLKYDFGANWKNFLQFEKN